MSAHRAIKPRRVRPSVNVGLFLTVVLLASSTMSVGMPTITASMPSHHIEVTR